MIRMTVTDLKYRLKGWPFFIAFTFSFGWSIFYAMSIYGSNPYMGTMVRMDETIYLGPFYASAILIAYNIGQENRFETLRSKVIMGHSRLAIAASELTVSVITATLLWLPLLLSMLTINHRITEIMTGTQLFLYFFGLYITHLTSAVIGTVIALCVRNQAAAVIVVGVILFLLFNWSGNLYSDLNRIDYHNEFDGVNHYYLVEDGYMIKALKRDVYKALLHLDPVSGFQNSDDTFEIYSENSEFDKEKQRNVGITNKKTNGALESTAYYMAGSFCTLLFITAAGVLIFKRKNLT